MGTPTCCMSIYFEFLKKMVITAIDIDAVAPRNGCDIQIIPIRQIEKPGARVKSNHINIGVSNFLKAQSETFDTSQIQSSAQTTDKRIHDNPNKGFIEKCPHINF